MEIINFESVNSNLDQCVLKILPSELTLIFKKKLFYFNADHFDQKFNNKTPKFIELIILGPPQIEKISNLEDDTYKHYQIRSIKVDNLVHQTFWNLIEDFNKLDEYKNAVKKFALLKLEAETEKIFKKNLFDDLKIDSSTSKKLFETSKKHAITFINDILGPPKESSTQIIVGQFLKKKNIQFKLNQSTFYYSFTSNDLEWNVEIKINDENHSLGLYSSISKELISHENFKIIYENMNALNLLTETGNFEYDELLGKFYFKQHAYLFDYKTIVKQLESLVQESEIRIQSIILILQNEEFSSDD